MADEEGSAKRKRDSPEEIVNLPTEACVERNQSVAHTELELPSKLTVSGDDPLPTLSTEQHRVSKKSGVFCKLDVSERSVQ